MFFLTGGSLKVLIFIDVANRILVARGWEWQREKKQGAWVLSAKIPLNGKSRFSER